MREEMIDLLRKHNIIEIRRVTNDRRQGYTFIYGNGPNDCFAINDEELLNEPTLHNS